MTRRMTSIAAVLTLLMVVIIGSSPMSASGFQQGSPVSASPATPAAIVEALSSLPVELVIQLLASADVSGLPNGSVQMRLDRISLSPGESYEGVADGNQLFLVETGTVLVLRGGEIVQIDTGGNLGVSPGVNYVVTTAETEGASFIRFVLADSAVEAPPAASPVSGVVPQLLVAGEGNRPISRRGTLFIAKIAIPAGGETGEQFLSAPIALAIQSGVITIVQETGEALTLTAGYGGIVQGFSHFNARNQGSEAAVILVAGLLVPVTGAAAGPTLTPSPAIDPSATSRANEASLASSRTAESDAFKATVTSLQTAVAVAETDSSANRLKLQGAETQIASAAAEVTDVRTVLANSQATISAQSSALAAADATQSANAETIAALIEANAGRSRELTSANATAETQQTEIAVAGETSAEQLAAIDAANVTATAMAKEVDAADATATAQAGVIATAEESSTRQAGVISSVVAIVESQSQSLQAANATATAQASAIEAADATATAQASAIEAANATATVQASAVNVANLTATAQAAAIETANANATVQAGTIAKANTDATSASESAAQTQSALETEIAQDAATGSAVSLSYEATVAAGKTAAAGAQSTLTSKSLQLQAAEATNIALSTAQADVASVAVASLNPAFVDLTVKIDLDGVLAGDQKAIAAAHDALQVAFAPYESCRAGVVLTFGHGETIGQGTRLAAALNKVIQEQYPAVFGGAAFDAFGNLNPPLGDADIRIYFFSGCDSAE